VAVGVADAPGEAPVLAGDGVGLGGLGGSTESRGLCRGGTITTPTTPSAPSSANGRT
jgi:hypothetical protein